ncbi:MAG: flagellar biosynthesis anti-sigma factor FlgM [Burkholderiaceae bacterium]
MSKKVLKFSLGVPILRSYGFSGSEETGMADSISGVGGRTLTSIKSEQPKGDVARIRSEESENSSGAIQPDTDRVELSVGAQAELDRAGFDAEKVDRIKQALADGNYPIDARRIAEGFSEFEKLL